MYKVYENLIELLKEYQKYDKIYDKIISLKHNSHLHFKRYVLSKNLIKMTIQQKYTLK